MSEGDLKKIRSSEVTIFKVRNRRGYAAICQGNLTEGDTPAQAFNRLEHPLRRMGFILDGSMPPLAKL